MAFDLSRFIARRPFCVHRTHLDNVASIWAKEELWPAARLYGAAGKHEPAERRKSNQDLSLRCPFGLLKLNDQDPFDERFGRFDDGMTAAEFRAELNRRVFFWPLSQDLDNDTGMELSGALAFAFLSKYAQTSALIVVPTRELIDRNPDVKPEFSRCNSGTLSSRTKKYNVRGRHTFLPQDRFVGTFCKVKEVVFRGPVRLPLSMRVIPAVAFG